MAVKIELSNTGIMVSGDNQKDIKAMGEPENLETIGKIAKTFFKSRNAEQLDYERKSAEISIENTRAIKEIGTKVFNDYCEELREAERKMNKRRIFNTLLKTLITTSGVIGCIIAGRIINGADGADVAESAVDISDVKQETVKKSTENKKK